MHPSGEPLNGWSHLREYQALPYSVKFLVEVNCVVLSFTSSRVASSQNVLAGLAKSLMLWWGSQALRSEGEGGKE